MDKRPVPAKADSDEARATAATHSNAGSFAARLDLRCDGLPTYTRRAEIEAAANVLAASGFDVDAVIQGRLAREASARGRKPLRGPLAEASAAFSIAQMAAASILRETQPQLEFELILRESALQ